MLTDAQGNFFPEYVRFDEPARNAMRDYRVWVRDMEGETQGLLKSFLGKTPGMLARVALVLGMLDWAEGGDPEPPTVLGMEVFDRAHVLVAEYLWPMARRSYAEASASSEERAARTLARWLQEGATQPVWQISASQPLP